MSELSTSTNSQSVKDALVKDSQTIDLLRKAYEETDLNALVDQFVEVASSGVLPGQIAFLLHDTYGFPVDLTQLMLREQSLGVDIGTYEVLMEKQKERARASSMFGSGSDSSSDAWQVISEGEDSLFIGYDHLEVKGATIRVMREQDTQDTTIHELVLDQTPFYAESGGQVGDTGWLVVGDEKIDVLDTKKTQNKIIHFVDRLPSDPHATVWGMVNEHRRNQIKKHHTATHLLHAVLRESLGTHVAQKGSLVTPDRLRFDFSHFERITQDQLRDIEARVNEVIQKNIPRIEERDVPVDEAMNRGATALFGEKYGDTVRIITFDPSFSSELCGGTHVDATGELGLFQFLSEGSVAAGVRRVEAVVGEAGYAFTRSAMDELTRSRSRFKVLDRPLDEAITDLISENKRLEKEASQAKMHQLEQNLDVFIKEAQNIQGLQLITGRVDDLDMEALRNLGQALRDRANENAVSVLGTVDPGGDKAYLVATVSDDLIKGAGIKAGQIVGTLAKKVGGGGGGKPTLATAGGKKPEHLDEALASAGDVLVSML